MARAGLLCLAACIVLAAPAAAMSPELPVHSFLGVIDPSGIVKASGNLLVSQKDPGFGMEWAYPGGVSAEPGSVVYNASTAELFVTELRWKTVAGQQINLGNLGIHDPSGASTYVSTQKTTMEYELGPSFLTATQHLDDSRWVAASHAGGRDASFRLQSGTRCDLAPVEIQPIQLSADSSSVWEARGSGVAARCEVQRMSVMGEFSLAVFGTEIRVDHVGPDSRLESLHILTGQFSSRNATNPLATDHVLRWLQIESHDAASLFEFRGTQEVAIETPALLIAGDLKIPSSWGFIDWGPVSLRDEVRPLEPAGEFWIDAPTSRDMGFSGKTTNLLPIPAPSSDGARELVVTTLVAGAVMLLAGRLGPVRLRLLLLGLFTRITQNRALSNARRKLIFDAIEANPATNVEAVCRLLGLERRIVDYHVDVLRNQDLIVARRFGKAKALFVKGVVSTGSMEAAHVLRKKGARTLVEALRSDPEQPQTRLAQAVGLSQARVSQLLQELLSCGVLRLETVSSRRIYRVAPDELASLP